MSKKLPNAEWLENKDLQSLLEILSADGEEAMVNGGAVRNSLLGEPVADVDISTIMLPEIVIQRLEAENIKVVPTGIEHGTVTAVINRRPYEITTLRADIETNGRHAVVQFGKDWREDAMRRDFTINALYVNRYGEILDPLDGTGDIEARRVRFIGTAEDRINEDHLRILRFFRFFAWYGHGAPDRESLKACVRMKHSIEELSVERVWSEFHKLLGAPDPARAILWMRQSGVLNVVLPESEKWGIDAFQRMVRTESELEWPTDPLLRLMAIIPPQANIVENLCERLKTSNSVRNRLENWATSVLPPVDIVFSDLGKRLYQGSQQGITDRMKLDLARLRDVGTRDDNALVDASKVAKLLEFSVSWQRPEFSVKGRDLVELGMKPGKEMGDKLSELELNWIESGFALGKNELLASF